MDLTHSSLRLPQPGGFSQSSFSLLTRPSEGPDIGVIHNACSEFGPPDFKPCVVDRIMSPPQRCPRPNLWNLRICYFIWQREFAGTSLGVQWLILCASNAGDLGLIAGQGTRSHTLQLKLGASQIIFLKNFKKGVCR